MIDPMTTRPELPPGFSIHNDGPGREVLVDPHNDADAYVFDTRVEAAIRAWQWWDTIYNTGVERRP